jgi:hypothetical protein
VSVILNEAALTFLLESPAGPVGQDLRRRSENVTRLVRENAQRIIEELDTDLIGFSIDVRDEGLVSVVGMTSGGRIDDYLAAKEQREQVIFAPALQQGLHI